MDGSSTRYYLWLFPSTGIFLEERISWIQGYDGFSALFMIVKIRTDFGVPSSLKIYARFFMKNLWISKKVTILIRQFQQRR